MDVRSTPWASPRTDGVYSEGTSSSGQSCGAIGAIRLANHGVHGADRGTDTPRVKPRGSRSRSQCRLDVGVLDFRSSSLVSKWAMGQQTDKIQRSVVSVCRDSLARPLRHWSRTACRAPYPISVRQGSRMRRWVEPPAPEGRRESPWTVQPDLSIL